MKKSIIISSAIAGILVSVNVHAAGDLVVLPEFKPCSVANLRGLYVFNSHGVIDGKAYTDSGHEFFDGKGHVHGHYVDSTGAEKELAGTYTVSAECEGTITYTKPEAAVESIFLGSEGEVFTYIQNGEGLAISGTETRQSSKYFHF